MIWRSIGTKLILAYFAGLLVAGAAGLYGFGKELGSFGAGTVILLCSVWALFFGWLIRRMVLKPVAEALRVAGAMAGGDLTVESRYATRDEFGTLLAALGRLRSGLASAVGRIRRSAEGVSLAASEIARGNADLSDRSQQQASSLEETSSSMEELTSTVKQNAGNAAQANQLAAGASEVAARGGAAVRGVVETMSGITESSKRIADIIGVIDSIAFQTNILALNAAVEAARAGEQGRGFAVVASEVRSLAQRSAEAAKQIKALIQESVGRVDAGTKQVESAGRTMDELLAAVKRVTDIMGEIAAASTEQLSGIEQVGAAVTQMDQVVQQNAALVEQAAAATENLASQSTAMVETVSRFRLGEEREGAAGVRAPALATPARASAAPPKLEQAPAGAAAARRVPRTATAAKRSAGPVPAGQPVAAAEGEWKEI